MIPKPDMYMFTILVFVNVDGQSTKQSGITPGVHSYRKEYTHRNKSTDENTKNF